MKEKLDLLLKELQALRREIREINLEMIQARTEPVTTNVIDTTIVESCIPILDEAYQFSPPMPTDVHTHDSGTIDA